jgi:alkylation response protein AidB-like acyl-CoA dehydrogenase
MKMDSLDAAETNVEREWLARARILQPLLAAAAPRIEQAKTMPPDVLEALRKAQMFRMMTPRSIGGAELDLATYAQVVATIAEGDASAAWCIAQISGSSMCSAYLDRGVAEEIFGTQTPPSLGDLPAESPAGPFRSRVAGW